MKKVLILGIKGMAGHVVYKYFQNIENFSTYGLARNIETSDQTFNVDVFETEKLSALILNNKFDFVVNCIGILNQDAENNPSKAIWFNSYFPHFLAQLTKDLDTQIIHISTDCVFNGLKGNYSESDVKDGIGFYAQSKSLGEIDNSKDLTIRTSIIGPELNENGIGLFNWFMKQNGEVNGYTSAYWSGVTTLELAKALHYEMENPISGLVHLTNGVPINKFDLINLFKEIWNKNEITVIPFEGKKVDKSLQKSDRFLFEAGSYQQMLMDQYSWMKNSSTLYQI
ncbi:dTDP-4-dehydrorhamnose reductase family protein [Kaistella sp.]|uniref:dTDP-4-dehydrorhamnose reductase family protein n=1 Tax=Kaistella sp. TaxID=2782235 RepID=UPI0035A19576